MNIPSRIEPLESRIAPAFGAVVDLSALTGSDGFQINGEDRYDFSGASVSDAGDLNGDGFDDLLIGNGRRNADASRSIYVVFGRGVAFGSTVEVADLDGVNGFQITGEAMFQTFGTSVSAAGDVNGDGFDDVIIGALDANPNGIYSGASYLVFGHAGPFSPTLDLSSLDGTNGFRMNGEATFDYAGEAVSGAGDVNGDGFDDLLISARGAGTSYLIFGHGGSFAATVELANLDGANGFRINSSGSVNTAGDLNGDGYDDVVIGSSFVVFGHRGTFAAQTDVFALNGTNGFQIWDINVHGATASSAGDLNGDGFDDLLLGAPGEDYLGTSYVLFGHGGSFTRKVRASQLDGTNGFSIRGETPDSGSAVSAAGDINGDGFDDLVIGDPYADVGPYGEVASVGASYVVFGHAGTFSRTLDLAKLTGRSGFKIQGAGYDNHAGWSVSGAGDFNADGFDDLLIGAPGASPNGYQSGASYVLFGPITANSKTATFSDVDGDRVTVTTSRGDFDPSNFTISPVTGSASGGWQFAGLHVNDGEFAGADFKITAQRTASGGDGLVNLGFLDATGIALGNVSIAGDLGRIEAASVRTLAANSMGMFATSTQIGLAPSLESHINGGLHLLNVTGDLVGVTFEVTGSIGRILAGSAPFTYAFSGGIKVGGTIDGSRIVTDGDLAKLKVRGNIDDSTISVRGHSKPADLLAAKTIGTLNVNGHVDHTTILVGYDVSGRALNADVHVSQVSVGTGWSASSLAVGVMAGPDGAFGSADDALIAGGRVHLVSRIGSIRIQGEAFGTIDGADHFGIVAEQILACRIGGATLSMTPGADAFEVGPTFDLTVRDEPPESLFAPPIAHLDLSALDGINGFKLSGAPRYSSVRVSGAGDVNGDGFDDIIIGTPDASTASIESGAGYVVFGNAEGFPADLDLSGLDGRNGFMFRGVRMGTDLTT